MEALPGYTPFFLPFGDTAMRILLAVLAGAAVGLEREVTNHSAGLRTAILTTLASAIFTLVSLDFAHGRAIDDRIVVDPGRVVQAITAGAAFLAAGTIIFAKGEVKGLTTGASLWVCAALGLAAGAGYYGLLIGATVLALLTLTLLNAAEDRWLKRRRGQ